MRIEPFPGFGIAIGADLYVGASRLVIDEIPSDPLAAAIRRILGRSIFLFRDFVPLPRGILRRESFPRLMRLHRVISHRCALSGFLLNSSQRSSFSPDRLMWRDYRRR